MVALRVLLFVALKLSALALEFEVSVKSSLHFDVDAAKNRPVSKVITLLKDMQKQLETEAEEDEEIYEKMACWCETNDKEKTKAIADAEARIEDLTADIEAKTAASARLNAEIKNLDKEIAKNQAALDKATALRQKELAEFNAEKRHAAIHLCAEVCDHCPFQAPWRCAPAECAAAVGDYPAARNEQACGTSQRSIYPLAKDKHHLLCSGA
jgi:hypothetical protein